MKYIVDVNWLHEHLEDVTVIDCRFTLGKADEGIQQYKEAHIPGAHYFHLETDLSGPVREHGGRHPLPEIDKLKKKLEQAGISNDTTVVVYDQGVGAYGARFFFLLKYFGHENVYVLNGGYSEWEKSGFEVTAEVPQVEPGTFSMNLQEGIIASYEQVRDIVQDDNASTVLIDSREEQRYLGIVEPIDKKAGHIPGAVNAPWMNGLQEGKYLPKEKQQERFRQFEKDKPLIVYCGSGVTAAPNFIALKEAGYENVKLYVGSFSDWISYEENEVEVKRN